MLASFARNGRNKNPTSFQERMRESKRSLQVTDSDSRSVLSPTICNDALMKGEYGRLPAFLSALQSAHVMGGAAGCAAASSPSLAHPRHTPHTAAALPKITSHTSQHQSDFGLMKITRYRVREAGI